MGLMFDMCLFGGMEYRLSTPNMRESDASSLRHPIESSVITRCKLLTEFPYLLVS